MNLSRTEAEAAAAALGRLDAWFATMRRDGGYTGPVVGLRGVSMAWCGAGHDWRWEGLLDGWADRHRRTGDAACLDRLAQALRDLQQAQLANGTFRNSYFESNPFEGGMPYEPAVMAAALRAGRYLQEKGRAWPEGAAAMVERFVEQRLVKELWNKTLRTFNNWLQSDFEVYSPPAVASIVETLCDYADLTGAAERWDPFIAEAAESLLKTQAAGGPLAGSLPVSNREGASASPYLAARCLPALARLQQRTDEVRFATAADRLADFVRRSLRPDGGIPFMVFAHRPARVAPRFVGATAGALLALERAGRSDAALAAAQLKWVLAHQSPSGAFDTAEGFGGAGRAPRRPDWRDVLPVCGWADKVYALLASLAPGAVPAAAVQAVRRDVTVRGRNAEFSEDESSLSLRGGGEDWFVWRKRAAWPDVCRL